MSHFFIGGLLNSEWHVVARGDRASIPNEVVFYQPAAVLLSDKMARKDAYPCRLPVQEVYRRHTLERPEDGAKTTVCIADGYEADDIHRDDAFASVPFDTREMARRDARGESDG